MNEILGQRVVGKNKVRNILLVLLGVSLVTSYIAYNFLQKEQKTKQMEFDEGTKIGLVTVVKSGSSYKLEDEQKLTDLSNVKQLEGYAGRQLSDGRYFVWKSGNNPLPAGFFNPESPQKGVINTIVASENSGLVPKLFALSPSNNFAVISAVSDSGENVITVAETTSGKTMLSRNHNENITDINFSEEKKIVFLTENNKLYTIKFY